MGIGGAYYPRSSTFGLDASAGYTTELGVVGIGYDVIGRRGTISLEAAFIEGDENDPPEAPGDERTGAGDEAGGEIAAICAGICDLPVGTPAGGLTGAAPGAPIDGVLR